MRPLSHMPISAARAMRGVFADIDDTITTEGRLPGSSYQALETLKNAGFAVVLITGRPAGWCDMIARFWPVDGVVGENGAFYFAYDHKAKQMLRRFVQSEAERAEGRKRLEKIKARVLAEVPGSAVASDQLYRESDLAIDFCEDVPALPQEAIDQIAAIYAQEGAMAKISSIHVNGWYGDYDKLTMTRIFARERLGLELDDAKDLFVYCGDSPNDAPMFGYFPNACGVANVRDQEKLMEHLPAYIAQSRGGEGFVEICNLLLEAGQQPASAMNI